MNHYRATISNTAGDRTRDWPNVTPRFRHATVGNLKGYELNPARAAKLRFALQSKLGNFLPFEKAYDRIQTGNLPFANVDLQPIISAGTSGDRYPPDR